MKKQFSLMRVAKYFFAASLSVIAIGVVMFFVQGFKYGIDFSGGTILTEDLKVPVTDADLKTGQDIVAKYIPAGYEIIPSISEKTELVLRYQDKDIKDTDAKTIRVNVENDLKAKYPSMTSVSMVRVGAVAGAELRRNAIISIVVACILMLLYVAIRFEFVYGIASIAALIHDVAIMTAFMIFFRVEVSSSFIAALLTIIGYSMNDTIVIFDRIRENNKKLKTLTKAQIIDTSFLQTLRRTINVSMTSFITITTLYILGVPTIKEFAFPLMVGIISGTYSSILIAAPIWMWVHDAQDRRRKKKAEAKKALAKGGAKKPIKAH
jgi:preprotein translocase subunit SecF